ncbi:MAG: hypothetical protein LBD12_06080 [Clostridiales Family XIII bacterium]|jgi:type VII secretion protein EssB|nr:hypothetical protein [Clostridiales Family XIII bacterium]
MPAEPIVLEIKNEESCLPKQQRSYLTFPNPRLIPAKIVEDEYHFDLVLDPEGLSDATGIKREEAVNQYRFLIAAGALEHLKAEYDFSLEPTNLMYDVNFVPLLKLRDGPGGRHDFLAEYKALTGAVLSKKYVFEDFSLGGEDLYGQDPLLAKVSEAQDVAGLQTVLRGALTDLQDKLSKERATIGKKKLFVFKLLIPVLAALVLALAFFTVKSFFFDQPEQERAIAISNHFLRSQYVELLRTMRDMTLEDLTKEERYMAAYSGVATTSLSDAQKQNVFKQIRLNTDSLYLEFWVEIGRANYENAVDIAKRLDDLELQLFSLILLRDAVEADPSMPGAEKAESLSAFSDQIADIEETLVPDEDAALPPAAVQASGAAVQASDAAVQASAAAVTTGGAAKGNGTSSKKSSKKAAS